MNQFKGNAVQHFLDSSGKSSVENLPAPFLKTQRRNQVRCFVWFCKSNSKSKTYCNQWPAFPNVGESLLHFALWILLERRFIFSLQKWRWLSSTIYFPKVAFKILLRIFRDFVLLFMLFFFKNMFWCSVYYFSIISVSA